MDLALDSNPNSTPAAPTAVAKASARAAFERDGWVAFPNLLPRTLVDRAIPRMEAVMSGQYETGRAPNGRNWNPDDPPTTLRKIDQANLSDRTILELISHPEIGRWASILTGARRVQVFGVQMLYKPPGGCEKANVGWHQDHQYWRDAYVDGGTLTAWIAISDVTEASGPMRLVPGSHKWGLRPGGDFFNGAMDQLKAAMTADGLTWSEVVVILPPGGVSFHHHLTIHGSGVNASPLPRQAFAVHLMTDQSTLARNAPASFLDQLNDPVACPVIYQADHPAHE